MATPTIQRLHSTGPNPDLADRTRLYAWLVGSWTIDATMHVDRGEQRVRGEMHAGWVLDGRALQDVWILPGFFYGTTLRVYDAGLDAWHILWSDPTKQYYVRQLGRAAGRDIVQLGDGPDGLPTRWRFSDIASDAFRWRGERSHDGGINWELQADFRLRRSATTGRGEG